MCMPLETWLAHPYYSHGLLIPFVAAWLVWRERHELPEPVRDRAQIAPMRDAGQVNADVEEEHPQTALLAAHDRPCQSEDVTELLLIAVLVHVLDVVAVQDPRGLRIVEIALARTAFAGVEVRHFDSGRTIGSRAEFPHRLLGHDSHRIVTI